MKELGTLRSTGYFPCVGFNDTGWKPVLRGVLETIRAIVRTLRINAGAYDAG